MKGVNISIIIVNYKTWQLTSNCINSIREHVHSTDYEIIVVDNASNDGSVDQLRSNFKNLITIIESKVNLGFGRANNLGARFAEGHFLFFLNSDTILLNDPFKYFISFYKQKESQVGALGGYLIDGRKNYTLSGGITYSARKYIKIALYGLLRKKGKPELEKSSFAQEIDYIIGADLFIESKLFYELNGFDPHIFMYMEDVELCERIKSREKKNYIIPGPQIMHLVKSSSNSQFSRVYNTASLMYCMRKKMSSFPFRLFQISYFAMKIPVICRLKNFSREWQYLMSIYQYNKYLVKE